MVMWYGIGNHYITVIITDYISHVSTISYNNGIYNAWSTNDDYISKRLHEFTLRLQAFTQTSFIKHEKIFFYSY